MDPFFMGATAMGFGVAGLFFLRFWRQTGDRLFLIFALAFGLLAGIRVALAFTQEVSEAHTFLYTLRFVAFLLILVAIVDKNRPRRPQESTPRRPHSGAAATPGPRDAAPAGPDGEA
jgi:hypothetical protein